MLYAAGPEGTRPARVTDVRQHPGVPLGGVAAIAAADLAELAAGRRLCLTAFDAGPRTSD